MVGDHDASVAWLEVCWPDGLRVRVRSIKLGVVEECALQVGAEQVRFLKGGEMQSRVLELGGVKRCLLEVSAI